MDEYFKNQLAQNEPIEMGLFTFYKQQQSESQVPLAFSLKHTDILSKSKIKKKKRNCIHNYINIGRQQQEPSQTINKSLNCYDFLKNIRPKRSLRLKQTFAKREQLNFSHQSRRDNIRQSTENPVVLNSRQDTCLDVEEQVELRYSNKKFDLGSVSNQESIPAYIIRKKYFNSERNKVANAKQVKSIEQNLVIKIQKKQIQNRKTTKESSIKPKLQQQFNFSFKRRGNKDYLMKYQSNREMDTIKQQMNIKSKGYINSLMCNVSSKPQYNQTAYKVLRQTFKLPSFRQKLKTQGTSITGLAIQVEKESQSCQRHNYLRQSTYQHKYLKIPIEKMLNSHHFTEK